MLCHFYALTDLSGNNFFICLSENWGSMAEIKVPTTGLNWPQLMLIITPYRVTNLSLWVWFCFVEILIIRIITFCPNLMCAVQVLICKSFQIFESFFTWVSWQTSSCVFGPPPHLKDYFSTQFASRLVAHHMMLWKASKDQSLESKFPTQFRISLVPQLMQLKAVGNVDWLGLESQFST